MCFFACLESILVDRGFFFTNQKIIQQEVVKLSGNPFNLVSCFENKVTLNLCDLTITKVDNQSTQYILDKHIGYDFLIVVDKKENETKLPCPYHALRILPYYSDIVIVMDPNLKVYSCEFFTEKRLDGNLILTTSDVLDKMREKDGFFLEAYLVHPPKDTQLVDFSSDP